jgi:hypothetical protein
MHAVDFRGALLLFGVALLGGCSSSSATFQEAESLAGQGKLEEAAVKFDNVCLLEPKSSQCPSADARASATRVKAAEGAIQAGQYKKAARLLRMALLGADEAGAKEITDRLAKDDLVQGLRYEDAAADPDKAQAEGPMQAVASSGTPAAEKAKAWLAAETPALLVQKVKAACGPKHEGSCSKLFAELSALPQKPAGFDDAKVVAEAEEKRIHQPLVEAERFLALFASRAKKKEAYQKCFDEKRNDGADQGSAHRACTEEIWEGKSREDRFDEEQNDESLFRQRLALIADPGLVDALKERKSKADAGTYEKAEIKQPGGGSK